MCEHLGILHKTGMPTKFNINTTSAFRDHIRNSGHINDFNNFETFNFVKNNLVN